MTVLLFLGGVLVGVGVTLVVEAVVIFSYFRIKSGGGF